MNHKILEILEFDKVKKLLENLLLTEQGLEEVRQLSPMVDIDRIQQAFDESRDMADLFIHYPHFT
ncbi:hypothetical protein ACXWO0_10295, partial [Streptococcus pyogenes]